MFFFIVVSTALLLLTRWLLRTRSNPKGLPYPPGPRALPIIGNSHQLPSSYWWLVYAEWAKKYGDIVHFEVLGKHFVVLNSTDTINELLEQRSVNYSDRPRMPMLVELVGWSWVFTSLSYGSKLRRLQKIFHQFFRLRVVPNYRPIQLLEARRTVLRLLDSPDKFVKHFQLSFTATIVKVVYGVDLRDENHPYAITSNEILRAGAIAGIPGAFFVDIIPILKYVPEWFPGANFKKMARRFRELEPYFVDETFLAVKEETRNGRTGTCLVSSALQSRFGEDSSCDYEQDVKSVAATAFVGGADTARFTMETIVFALMHNPDIQKEAQERVDEVVGRDRLPEFEDLDRLPYVRAIVMEAMRWQPVLPLAVAHAASVDDEYRGYYIPKGAIVIGNSWSVLHDETVYPDPHAFNPKRFLNQDGSYNESIPDPELVVFGFGRRKCPGRYFALDSTLMITASILACCEISFPKDETPRALKNDQSPPVMTSGLTSSPLPFKCNIQPRSPSVPTLVSQTLRQMTEMGPQA